MSILSRLFQPAPKKPDRETLLWLELAVPKDTEPVPKKILNTLAGKGEPLTAEADIAEFLNYDWQRVKNLAYEIAIGKSPCLMPYFQRILETWPNSARALFALCEEEMARGPRLLYLAQSSATATPLAAEAAKWLPAADFEERAFLFRLLGECPSEQGCALLLDALKDDDWRIAMKAAAALAETGETRYGEAIVAAAEVREPGIAKGLKAIARQLKEKGATADETVS